MNYFRLIWSGLWRKPMRTVFTLLSIVVAFLLFGMLQGVGSAFSEARGRQHLDILVTNARFYMDMPYSYYDRVKSIPGITGVAYQLGGGGAYGDGKNGFGGPATDPALWFAVGPQYQMPKEQLQALINTRTGVAVSVALAKKYGFKIGDKFTLKMRIPKTDGSTDWSFDVVGIFDNVEDPGSGEFMVWNYSYLNEARADNKNTLGRLTIRIADPDKATTIARDIDALFASSGVPTSTKTEKEFSNNQLQQIGDVGFFTKAIIGAVFFTLLFLTGNTMMQSVHERIPELAVLKTLGYSDTRVGLLVLAESTLLCLLGAVLGLCATLFVFPLLRQFTGLGGLPIEVITLGLGIALLVALLTGLLPTLRVARMQIVTALNRH